MSLVVRMLASAEVHNQEMRDALVLIAEEADRSAKAIGASARRGDQSMAETFRWIRDTALKAADTPAFSAPKDNNAD